MAPIVSIVGSSGSGKTTFPETLIPELSARGCRVGAVKHILVRIDGKRLPMKRFPAHFVSRSMTGMLSSLKGRGGPRTVSSHIRSGEDD